MDDKNKPMLRKSLSISRDSIQNDIKSPNSDRTTSPPEFLVRRNEIFAKRSTSIEYDPNYYTPGGGGGPSFGPLKGSSEASSLHFKGIHPNSNATTSRTGTSYSSAYNRKSNESRDRQTSVGRKEVRAADGSAGEKSFFAPVENKAVTLSLGRYVNGRAGHKSRAPPDFNAYRSACKMGEDSNVDIATIKDRNSPDSDKSSERHSVVEESDDRRILNKKKGIVNAHFQNELSYGPGFVDKLKSRFISLSLNDKNKAGSNLRRFSSLENVLDSDNEYNTNDVIKRKRASVGNRTRFRGAPIQSKNSFKRAKSMETLLLEPAEHRKHPVMNGGINHRSQRPISMTDTISGLNFINENVVIIEKTSDGGKSESNNMVSPQENGSLLGARITKKRDNIINRQVTNISDEELPKPDTVKTYKLFFEPVGRRTAGSNNQNNARKSPVARQSAKNSVNNKSSSPVLKNGSTKSGVPLAQSNNKTSAKDNKPVIVNGNVSESQEKRSNLFAKESVKLKNVDNEKKEKVKATGGDEESKTKDVVTSNGFNKKPHHSTELSLNLNRSRPVPEAKTPIKQFIPSPNNEAKSELPVVINSGERKISNNTTPQVSPKQESIPIIKTNNAEKINDKPEKPITFQKPESETGLAQQQLHPPTPKEVATPIQNKMEISSRGPVLSPSVEAVNGISNESYEKVATKSNSIDASPSPSAASSSEAPKNEPEDVLKPSALLGNKKSGLWQKTPPSQMSTTFVYNFVGKDVKSHLPSHPAPFGCKPVRSKKKNRDSLENNKEGLNLKNNGLDLGDIGGGESNDYDDSDEEADQLDIGSNLPAASGITFLGENASCSKTSLLQMDRRKKNLNIVFAQAEPSVFVYPSEDSVYEDLESLTSSAESASNGTPSPEEQEVLSNHVGQLSSGLRNTPSLGGATGALSSYTPSMLSAGESFQLGVSRSAFHQDIPKTEAQPLVNPEEPPKEEELVPADPSETSSWSSSTTSDLLF